MSDEERDENWPKGLFWLLALILLGILIGPALFAGPALIGDGVDLYGTVWFYSWIADSILQLRDPTMAIDLFYPYGKDLFSHTGNNFLDALLAAPFVWVLGVGHFQPLFTAAILLFNALSFRHLVKRFELNPMATDMGALLFMVSPFCLAELTLGRPTQALMGFSLLSMSHFYESCRNPNLKSAILAGFFAALSGWTYWFGGYFLGLALCLTAILTFQKNMQWLKAQAIALSVCFLCIAPAIIPMILRVNAGDSPGMVSVFQPDMAFSNNVSPEVAGYFLSEPSGFPMFQSIVWGGGVLVAAILSPRKWWLTAMCFFLLFATGPIWPTSTADYEMHHYQLLSELLPFWGRLWFPYRMVSFALLAAAIGLSGLLCEVGRRTGPKKALVLGFLMIGITLLEQSRFLAVPLHYQPYAPPSTYLDLRTSEKTIVELPLNHARPSVMWLAGGTTRVLGGIGENAPVFHPPKHRIRLQSPLLYHLSDLETFADDKPDLGDDPFAVLRAQGFDMVVWDRKMTQGDLIKNCRSKSDVFVIQHQLIALFGRPQKEDGSFLLWNMTTKTDEKNTEISECCTNVWSGVEYSPIEIRLKAHGRLPEEVGAEPCQKDKGE